MDVIPHDEGGSGCSCATRASRRALLQAVRRTSERSYGAPRRPACPGFVEVFAPWPSPVVARASRTASLRASEFVHRRRSRVGWRERQKCAREDGAASREEHFSAWTKAVGEAFLGPVGVGEEESTFALHGEPRPPGADVHARIARRARIRDAACRGALSAPAPRPAAASGEARQGGCGPGGGRDWGPRVGSGRVPVAAAQRMSAAGKSGRAAGERAGRRSAADGGRGGGWEVGQRQANGGARLRRVASDGGERPTDGAGWRQAVTSGDGRRPRGLAGGRAAGL